MSADDGPDHATEAVPEAGNRAGGAPASRAVRRVGRRRVVTSDAPGVVRQVDPMDDAAAGGSAQGGALDARDRWLLEQRPPHWG